MVQDLLEEVLLLAQFLSFFLFSVPVSVCLSVSLSHTHPVTEVSTEQPRLHSRKETGPLFLSPAGKAHSLVGPQPASP